MQITESLLTEIVEQQAECVIIDITGIPIVDTQVAQYLPRPRKPASCLAAKWRWLVSEPKWRKSLVQLGVDLRTLTTLANLQAGIAWAFNRYEMKVVNDA